MKLAPAAVQKLKKLIDKLDARFNPQEPSPMDPITRLVVAFLQWESTTKQADRTFEALMAELVDINELRVSHPHELVEALDDDDPLASERIMRLRESLNEIYIREYAVEMKSIADKPKKDQRLYLDTLPGMTPYAAASVMLFSFGGHAMPVDGKLAILLSKEGIFEAGVPVDQVEDALLKEVKAADAMHTHLLLQAWSDGRKRPEVPAPQIASTTPPAKKKKGGARKKPAAKKAASKKSAAPKPPAKKPASKKPAASAKSPRKKTTPARKK